MADKVLKSLVKNQAKLRDKNAKIFSVKLRRLLDSYLPKVLDFDGIELDEAASVIGGLQTGLIEAGLGDLVDDLRESYNEELQTLNAMLSPFTTKKIFSTADKEIVETLIDYNGEKIKNLVAPYIDDVGSTALRYAITGEKPDIDAILEKAGDTLEYQVETEVNTLLSGFSRTVSAKKAAEFELGLFLYYGPDDKITRDFCEELLNESPPIYTLEEIEAMDNDQGLDVLTNCGGYNCRHQWIPITEEKALELGYKV